MEQNWYYVILKDNNSDFQSAGFVKLQTDDIEKFEQNKDFKIGSLPDTTFSVFKLYKPSELDTDMKAQLKVVKNQENRKDTKHDKK